MRCASASWFVSIEDLYNILNFVTDPSTNIYWLTDYPKIDKNMKCMKAPQTVPSIIAGQHTCCAGATRVNGTKCLPLPSVPSIPAAIVAHALLMVVGWMMLLSVGASMAFFKTKKSWFDIHVGLQIAGLVLTIVGAALAMFYKKYDLSAHKGFGIFITVLAIVQAFGGIMRPHKEDGVEDESQPFARRVWKLFHSKLGIALVIAAFVNVCLGLLEAITYYPTSTSKRILPIAVFVVFLAIMNLSFDVYLLYDKKDQDDAGGKLSRATATALPPPHEEL